jgi:phenylacetate-CoA ligase
MATKGELVFTSLTKGAFPIIRYRMPDLTRLLPGTARNMRRMEKVTSRSDDMIILRGVNEFPTQIEAQLLATAGLSPHFPLELTRDGHMDRMTVHVEATDGPMGSDALAQAAEAFNERIKTHIGLSVEIAAHGSGGGPRSRGKAIRILDNRPRT